MFLQKFKVGINVFSAKTFRWGNFSQGKTDDKFINKFHFSKKFSPISIITSAVNSNKVAGKQTGKNFKNFDSQNSSPLNSKSFHYSTNIK